MLLPPPSDDLIDALLRNTKRLSDAGSALTRFISREDFGVAVRFLWHPIGLWRFREWAIIEHLHDVKRRQPDIEASCGFEPLRTPVSALIKSPCSEPKHHQQSWFENRITYLKNTAYST
jgi:hypothetical protein